MELIEKAAYLQGLLEGLELDESTKEGKVLHAMSDLLADMAAAIKTMEQDITQAEDELELLRDDVEELQSDVYEDDDEDAPCYEVDCPGCGETVYVTEEDLDAGEAFCPNCGCTFEVMLDDGEADDDAPDAPDAEEQDVSYEVTCPGCGAVTVLDEETLLSGKARCASCGSPLEIEMPDDEDGEETEEDGN